FPRLNETNYTEWSIRMEAQLIRLGLWNQVVCDIWEALARLHVARGFATRLALRRGFLRLVKGNDERMAAWIGRVKAFSFRLEDVGVEVTDEDRILALTNGLDKTYEAFLISLDATPPDLLSLAHVVDRLLNEE
ncbi:hypothetical protein HYPSUDRAFT_106098, partial [Hypholoma sublateritium FD-334 SS-4]